MCEARRLRIELGVGLLGASDHLLLLGHGKALPGLHIVGPALQQQHAAAGGGTVGHLHDARQLRQVRVLGAVDEAGEVAVVVVDPTLGLVGQRGPRRDGVDERAAQVEDRVLRAALHPDRHIMLGGGHREVVEATQRTVEARQAGQHVLGHQLGPHLGAKADHGHAAGAGHQALVERADDSPEHLG